MPCPNVIYVVGNTGHQSPITKEEFDAVATELDMEWLRLPVEEQTKILVRSSKWQAGKGIYYCEDAHTKEWVRSRIQTYVNPNGVRYQALGERELRLRQATVKLSSSQASVGAMNILLAAFKGLNISGTYLVQEKLDLKDGGQLVRMLMDLTLAHEVQIRDNAVPAGPNGYLHFRFRGGGGNVKSSTSTAEVEMDVNPASAKPSGNSPEGGDVNEVTMEGDDEANAQRC